MSRDSHKAVSQYLGGHQMATTNPFNLPMRPITHWDDNRDRTSEQRHESAMYQFGLMKGPTTVTPAVAPQRMRVASASDQFEAVHQRWEERGWLIQKHERRLKDSNKLLSKMWRRLDPYGRVLELLNTNATVRRHAERRAEPAFSESHSVQELFYQLAAYDYLHAIDPGFNLPTSTSHADPALTEKRLNSLASTVKIQSGLLQEKNDTIEKLRIQLDAQRRSQTQQLSAHQKDKDDAIDRLEKQLKKANVKISRLHNASQPSKPKPGAKSKAPVVKVCCSLIDAGRY
jgi:DNA-binding protein H-NS